MKEGDVCLIVGGAEHRPEDIGKHCSIWRLFQPGEVVVHENLEYGVNDCGEAAWLVFLDDGDGAWKRAAWLLPLTGERPLILQCVEVSK